MMGFVKPVENADDITEIGDSFSLKNFGYITLHEKFILSKYFNKLFTILFMYTVKFSKQNRSSTF